MSKAIVPALLGIGLSIAVWILSPLFKADAISGWGLVGLIAAAWLISVAVVIWSYNKVFPSEPHNNELPHWGAEKPTSDE